MIEDAIKIVKNHYSLGEIVNTGELHGGFIKATFVIITGLAGIPILARRLNHSYRYKNVPITLRQGPHVFKRANLTTSYNVLAG